MKLISSLLFLAALSFGQTPAQVDYVAYVLMDSSTVATQAGVKLPTEVLIYGRPVTTPLYVEIVVVTPQGEQKTIINQSVTQGLNWVHLITINLPNSGQTVTSISVTKLNMGNSASAPVIQ